MIDPATGPAMLYTQDGCPDSARVGACLTRSSVPFTERNVTGNDASALALPATGVFATPLVVNDGPIHVAAPAPESAQTLNMSYRDPSRNQVRR